MRDTCGGRALQAVLRATCSELVVYVLRVEQLEVLHIFEKAFGASHASTALTAALAFALLTARDSGISCEGTHERLLEVESEVFYAAVVFLSTVAREAPVASCAT